MNRISDLTRRLWAALLALCLVLALTLPVFAEGESETADTAEKETFHIGTVDDLLQLADSCRLDSWSQNRTVVLEADIDLSSVDFNGIPSFGGTWEGQNHAITGLSLSQDGSVQGLFRYVQFLRLRCPDQRSRMDDREILSPPRPAENVSSCR